MDELISDLRRAIDAPAFCCKIDCNEKPDYVIRTSNSQDEYVHSCLAHIPDLMTDAAHHYISKI